MRSLLLALLLVACACGGSRKGAATLDGAVDDFGASFDLYPAPDAGGRDWTTAPAIVELDGVDEIWALSDVHGDEAALAKLLAGAGVITKVPSSSPSDVRWNQKQAALVVVGDLIDKGPDAVGVITLLAALQTSARAAGGHVIVTMGNHEAEFLADPINAHAVESGVQEGFDPELAAADLLPVATAEGDNAIGAFVRALPIAARVGNWFFVHAGDTGGSDLPTLRQAIVDGVGTAGFGAPILADPASLLEARLSSSGPQWWDATGNAVALLGGYTGQLGVSHLVMGHQPGEVGFADGTSRPADHLFAAYSGLLFLIDTGMSVGVDHTGGALLHIKDVGGASESWEEVLPSGAKKSL